MWDDGKQGNYWSDYNGTDANGDGIGDSPYIIDYLNQDRYPSMKSIASSPTVAPTLHMELLVAIALSVVAVAAVLVMISSRKRKKV